MKWVAQGSSGLKQRCRTSLATAACALVLGGLLSLGMETLQYFMPSRDSALFDVIINTLSVLLGVVVYLAWQRIAGQCW